MDEGNTKEFRVRAVTSFICLTPDDFVTETETESSSETSSSPSSPSPSPSLRTKISRHASFLKHAEKTLTESGYEVQTVRIATNPFGEYLAVGNDKTSTSTTKILLLKKQLRDLDHVLNEHGIEFCALGPARDEKEVECCPFIVEQSHRLSCSAELRSGDDVAMARKAAECMKIISQMGSRDATSSDDWGGPSSSSSTTTTTTSSSPPPHVMNGLGNFQFCATACCKPFTPFFPAGRSTPMSEISDDDDKNENTISFALGLENGKLARRLLNETQTLDRISTTFRNGMANALTPLSNLCKSIAANYVEGECKCKFVGIDTSLNPSLDENGSVAEAMEEIDILGKFGGRGSVATAAEITQSLKNLPGIDHVGYSGLMLPVCEDRRLAELANKNDIDTTRLLGISSVCGVGLDTIPIPGDSSVSELMSLILDVGSLAYRYDKSLSCRLLLCPGLGSGDQTNLNSPYMCECKIFQL